MKKTLSIIMTLAMILTLFAGCGTTAAPTPDPVEDTVEVAPTATPTIVEGVVKEASLAKITVALADGTTLAFDTTGIAGLEVGLGDTVKVEYAGEIGSLVATSVTVTEKAEITTATVTGIVTKIEDGFVFLTLEDGSEAALKTESVEEYDVEVGDTLTVEYVDTDTEDGVDVVSVEVTKAEKVEEETPAAEAVAPETTAPAAGSQSGNANTGNNGTSSGTTGSAQASQVSTQTSGYTTAAEVLSISKTDINFRLADGTKYDAVRTDRVMAGLNGHNLKAGDRVVLEFEKRDRYNFPVLVRITLDKAASNSYDDDDWNDDDYYDDDDDEEDYTPSGKPSSGSSSKVDNPPADAGDVYEAIRLINAERVKAGLPELEIDSALMEMAEIRAKEVADGDYNNVGHSVHYRPDGTYFSSLFEEYDWKYSLCKENADASQASASKTIERWMNSSAHKSNILNGEITKIGLGYCYDSSTTWKHHWIMLAATPR